MYNDSTPNNKRNLWCNFDSEYDFLFDELHQNLSSSKFFSDKKSMPSNVIFNSETAKKITIKVITDKVYGDLAVKKMVACDSPGSNQIFFALDLDNALTTDEPTP